MSFVSLSRDVHISLFYGPRCHIWGNGMCLFFLFFGDVLLFLFLSLAPRYIMILEIFMVLMKPNIDCSLCSSCVHSLDLTN